MSRTILLLRILLVVMALAAFGGVLRNGFVYDDLLIIHGNPSFVAEQNWSSLFSKDYFTHSRQGSYRPMATLTYMIDGALWGGRPFGYHLTNLLLHVANVLLLFAAMKEIPKYPNTQIPNEIRNPKSETGQPEAIRIAFIASAFFAVHPVFTEVVSFPNYREDLLVLFWSLLAIWCHCSTPTHPHSHTPTRLPSHTPTRLPAFFYFLALLSKESGLGLFLFLGLCLWLSARRRPRLSSIAAYAIPTIAYGILRFGVYSTGSELKPPYLGDSFFLNAFTMPGVILSYLKMLLWPTHLRADYLIGPVDSVGGYVVSGIGLVVLIGAWLWVLKHRFVQRNDLLPAMALGWFLCFLLPVMNLYPIAHPMAERYLYIPCAGLFVLLGLTLNHLSDRLPTRMRAAFTGSLALSLAAFIALAQAQVIQCESSLSLWKQAVRCEPGSALAHGNLGAAYQDQGCLNEALVQFRRSMTLRPTPAMELNLARLKGEMEGSQDESIAAYEKTLSNLPPDSLDLPLMHHGLAIQLRKAGRLKEAIASHQKAIELKPNLDQLHLHYGITLQQAEDYAAARSAYGRALSLFPERAQTHYRSGTLHEIQKNLRKAQTAYEKALSLDPDYIAARGSLAIVLARQGAAAESLEHFEQALAAIPDNASWRFSYALALLKSNQAPRAFAEFEKIDPKKLPALQRAALEEMRRKMKKNNDE